MIFYDKIFIMKFATILSGSSGNCTYIESGNTRLLVDAGCTIKALTAALSEYGCSPRDIDAILITHEHSDHIKGVMRLVRRFDIPVWASEQTWEALPFKEDYSEWEHHIYQYGMKIGDIELEFFRLSHDAVQPVGICFSHDGKRVAVATDTGIVTPSMAKILLDCDGLVMEANHDPYMLMHGPYAYSLKQRVLSQRGHLSNAQAGAALQQLVGEHTRHVILAHLSDINNTPELALQQINAFMQECPYSPCITIAPRYAPHELIEL